MTILFVVFAPRNLGSPMPMMRKDEKLREAGQPGVPGRGSGCVPMTRRAYETMIAGHGALRDTDVRRRSVSFSVEKFK